MILGLDFGTKNIGLAISDKSCKMAFPLKTILNNKNVFQCINHIIDEYNISKVVVGIPTIKERQTKNTNNVKEFFNNLQIYISIPCILYNENFSTKTALKILKSNDLQKKKKDELSACLFLQWYLDTEYNK